MKPVIAMREQGSKSGGWQLEGSAAEAYERYFVPKIFAPWAERLVDAAEIGDDDRVLDVACGTGIVARRAALRVGDGGSVVGLDVNEGMLEVAAATASEEGVPVEWRQGDATALPFEDERFDVVCCQQAIQFVENPGAALAEMRRVLAPGGRALVSVWRPLEYNHGYQVLVDALEQHVGNEAGAMMRSPFPSWERADLEEFLAGAGFDSHRITIEVGSVRYPSAREFIRQELASSPLAAELEDASVRASLVRDVERGLTTYVDDEGVISPMETYVLAARRKLAN